MREVFIVDASAHARRPARRRTRGPPRRSGARAVIARAASRRTGVDPAAIDDVIFGCANQAGEDNRNVARMALLLAGLPVRCRASTVNRLCGSGMQAVADGARAIATGEAELVIAGGVESMSRAPLVMPKPREAFPRGDVDDARHHARLALRQPAHDGAARH